MKRTVISVLFTFMLTILISQAASASENPTQFEDQIQELSTKYDIQLSDSNVTTFSNQTPLAFDTIEEFEEFLKTLTEEESLSTTEEIIVTQNDISLFSTIYSGTIQRSWWGPMNGPVMGVLNQRNLSFNYTYKFVNNKPQYVSVSNIDSWQTGYHDVKWTHKSGTSSFSTVTSYRDTATVVAKGIYTLGVVIGSQPIGFTWNGEWDRTITLVTS
ncbi:hypothetical protein ACIQVU_20030 [Lysinibacillus sp. NPDC098008]|uniref:hypothetical protein n=1 Tax=Lysinibacillus sp. NPDC098008 TaxID=3364146 RepID=UPI00382D8756